MSRSHENSNSNVWTFPTVQAIKAIGFDTDPVAESVQSILDELQLQYNKSSFRSKKSSSGKYVSITVQVRFTEMAQVENLYGQLHKHPHIVQSL